MAVVRSIVLAKVRFDFLFLSNVQKIIFFSDDGNQLSDLTESASETFEMKPVVSSIDVPVQS